MSIEKIRRKPYNISIINIMKKRLYWAKGKRVLGESYRYGFIFSVERIGIFIIIHLGHIRKWIGITYFKKYEKDS